MDVALALASVGIAILGAIGGLLAGHFSGRRSAESAHFELRSQFDALATSTANLHGQAREYMDRGASHIARASAAEANTRRKTAVQQEPQMDEPAYRAHLESGGRPLPEVEQALGL